MSTTTQRLPFARARQLADCLVADLRPGCERIEVAGSLRRRCPFVGDIEIVAVPHDHGFGATMLDSILVDMEERKFLRPIKGGNRYRQFELLVPASMGLAACSSVNLDLFLAQPETWGWIYCLRTGPATWTKRMVTARSMGGLCPAGMRFADGRIWRGEQALATPEEADVFRVLGLEWVEPWSRKA